MKIKLELSTIDSLIVMQALSLMILDNNVHPDDRLIAYKVKKQIDKSVRESSQSTPVPGEKNADSLGMDVDV